MKTDAFVKAMLALIAGFLAVIAFRPWLMPPAVQAQSRDSYPLYFEPGTSMLRATDGSRQVVGKVAIDMRSGDVWGFPTVTQVPYPVDSTSTKPPTSHPIYLGKFALADIEK